MSAVAPPDDEARVEPVPRARLMSSALMHGFGRLLFAVSGWTIVGHKPDLAKYVLIAAPHTSNWDALWLIGAAGVERMEVSFLAKRSLFVGPLGVFLRALGVIPLDRGQHHHLVERAVDWLRRADRFSIGMFPEGTRRRTEGWRTGFYRIALLAEVPVALVYLDYRKREIGMFPELFHPTGDLERDFARLRELYEPCVAARPEGCSPVVPVHNHNHDEAP